ncbi:hypothetical protein L2E82_00056 [Cichorium intybus]|uniref:Uncharacterized protein n=1 Tax=Cichorium intybus TaxID=13427 RepID=A0ACB9GXE7_CICIN|nr:hypothetical protein L2E82_00056 [Cichorium intybus]
MEKVKFTWLVMAVTIPIGRVKKMAIVQSSLHYMEEKDMNDHRGESSKADAVIGKEMDALGVVDVELVSEGSDDNMIYMTMRYEETGGNICSGE